MSSTPAARLVQAQTDYAVSRYDYIVSVIQLRLAAGNLSPNDVTEINKWLASPHRRALATDRGPAASPRADSAGAPPRCTPRRANRNSGSINPSNFPSAPRLLSTNRGRAPQSDRARPDPTAASPHAHLALQRRALLRQRRAQ